MRLTKLTVKNFRSIHEVDISFPTFYSALCGANNAGKSNVLTALQAIFPENDRTRYRESDSLQFKRDITVWKKEEAGVSISIAATLEVHASNDAGLYQFIGKLAALVDEPPVRVVRIRCDLDSKDEAEPTFAIDIDATTLDDFTSKEVLKKFRTSESITYVNSTSLDDRLWSYRNRTEELWQPAGIDPAGYAKAKEAVESWFRCVSEKKQTQFADILGSLETRLELRLTAPEFNVEYLPLKMSLGLGNHSVPLERWGSGTRNRTRILLALLSARQAREKDSVSDRIKPILVVEEPESFLHPSAQAEFGRVMQRLAGSLESRSLRPRTVPTCSVWNPVNPMYS